MNKEAYFDFLVSNTTFELQQFGCLKSMEKMSESSPQTTFEVKPGQKAILTFVFKGPREMNVDILFSGTYNDYPDGRIEKRIVYRNVDHNTSPFDTGINISEKDISYDVKACWKEVRHGRSPWIDFESSRRESRKNGWVMIFYKSEPDRVPLEQHISVTVEVVIS